MKQKTKASKGILFIVIGLLFLFVTFYKLDYDYSRFSEFAKETIFNYIFALAFSILGILEIIESGIFKKAGEGNEY